MGKAADNERIRLRATLFNNISVGLVIVGTAAPLLAAYSKLSELTDWNSLFWPISGSAAAFICAALMHWWAMATLKKIED